jgi:dipeptidase D
VASNNKFNIAEISGGSLRNAIPREAETVLVMETSTKGNFITDLKAYEKQVYEEYQPMEKELKFVIEEDAGDVNRMMNDVTGRTLLHLLEALPDGVLAMSYSIPDLVETSTNLATLSTKESEIVIGMLSRSSVDTSMKAVEQRLGATGALGGASVEHSNFYPGWKANLESNLLKVASGVHKNLFDKEPEVKAIHAGLETGIIGVKFPGMDMISIGPIIEHPHSPEERVQIQSVENFWKFVTAILAEVAK